MVQWITAGLNRWKIWNLFTRQKLAECLLARNCCRFEAVNICIQCTKCTSVRDGKTVERDMSVSIIAFLVIPINFYYCKHHHCLFGAVASIRESRWWTHFFHFVFSSVQFHSVISIDITTTPCSIRFGIRTKVRERKRPCDSHWLILPDMKRDCFEWKMQIFCVRKQIRHIVFSCKHASQS